MIVPSAHAVGVHVTARAAACNSAPFLVLMLATAERKSTSGAAVHLAALEPPVADAASGDV